MAGLPFLKMHGLGNDFVIVDGRDGAVALSADIARAVGHRRFGVGFDQLALILPSAAADAEIRFFNADGSLAEACGNATRCVTRLLLEETGGEAVELITPRGRLIGRREGAMFSVNMGQPQVDWREIPLARDVDVDALPLEGKPSAVSMGNPHCVFFVEDAEAVDLPTVGPRFEHDPLFPNATNVEFMSPIGPDHFRMRVWERGTGITLACGSGACAAAVAAHRRGLSRRRVVLDLDGGQLEIDWREDGVWMTGPAAKVFEGVLSPELMP